ncbi:MAG: DUF4854 domain-containing protein [Ruminococcus sp.]|nr:DUF4854 domain-containing protein [Ruminococcus sp.]
MKKLLAVLSCLTICLSFAACGTKDDSSAEKVESKASVESSVEESEVSTDVSEGKTIQDFIDENKETFDVLKDALKDSGMEMDILARENSLVYTYKYTTDVGDTETVKAALDQGLESQKDTFVQVLDSLKLAVPTTESVIVEYLDMDGNVITSGEFK